MGSLKFTAIATVCIVGIAASLVVLATRDDGSSESQFFVLTPDDKAYRLTADVNDLATQWGMNSATASTTDAQGNTLYVVNARDKWIWLTAANVPLSGQESPDLCGTYQEPHPDPGQYSIFIKSWLPRVSDNRVADLATFFKAELTQRGYEIRDSAITCSPLSKQSAS